MELSIPQIISTFSALLPIIIGSFALKRDKLVKYFWFFLLIGFFNDNAQMIYIISGESEKILEIAVLGQNIYSLIDACFLFLFLGLLQFSKKSKEILFAASILMIPTWYICYFIIKDAWFVQSTLSGLYDGGYAMLLSVASAFTLLQMTKPNQQTQLWKIWLCVGIFFYNFCSFFIHAFIGESIISNIWYVSSIINILTMLLYSIGMYYALNKRQIT